MTDDEVIRLNYDYYSGLFPKSCSACGRRFATLREYIVATDRIGATISYDAELGDWQPVKPIGAAALANCPCGTTLSLTTEGLPVATIHALLDWIKTETQRRGVTSEEILDYLRDEVRKMALADDD